MMKDLVIVGAGENAEHAFRFVEEYSLYNVIGFAVDSQYKESTSFLNKPLFTLERLDEEIDKNEVEIFVALLWNRLNADRKALFERLRGGVQVCQYHFAYSKV